MSDKLWSARIAVVELVLADIEEAAVANLLAKLRAAGFQLEDGDPGRRSSRNRSRTINRHCRGVARAERSRPL